MKLVVDLQGMQNGSRQRGIGRYVASIAHSLSQLVPKENLRFIVSNLFPDTIPAIQEALADVTQPEQFVVFSGIGPTAELDTGNEWRRFASETLYQQFVEALAPDALLIGSLIEGAGDNSIAAFPAIGRNYQVAVILYDLIPLLNPSDHLRSKSSQVWYHRKLAMMQSADMLLAISESARSEAIEHSLVAAEKIVTIGTAASSIFTDPSDDLFEEEKQATALCNYYGIERPFIMHTSAFEPRKNFTGLIHAFSQLPNNLRTEHQLVLVCKLNDRQRYQLSQLIAELGIAPQNVILPGYIPDAELRLLYQRCALFVFPSFHEGFGLPALEAMWCGAPTIGSNRSSIPEVIGLNAALFDPSNPLQMAQLMARSIIPGPFRDELIAHAQWQCRQFSWHRTASLALAALSQTRCPMANSYPVLEFQQLLEKLVTWPGGNGPSSFDLAAAARAIISNQTELAAVDRWVSTEPLINQGFSLAAASGSDRGNSLG